MPGKAAQILHHFYSWLSIFYPDSCDGRLLPLFSHPSIIYRVWLITPNTLSSSLSTTDLPESCTLWHTFARQVIWTPRQRRIASSRQVFFLLRETALPVHAVFMHISTCDNVWGSACFFFWLELTDFLSCVVSFNSLWCSFKEVNSNFQLHVSNLFYSNERSFQKVDLLLCFCVPFCEMGSVLSNKYIEV